MRQREMVINLEPTEIARFKYPEHLGRKPPYVTYIWAFLLPALVHYLFWSFWMTSSTFPDIQVPLGIVTLSIFPLAIFIGAYLGLATTRYRKAIDAIDLLTSTVESTGVQIMGVEEAEKRKECHRLFVYLLRAIYAAARNIEVQVRRGEQVCGGGHAPILGAFAAATAEAGIDKSLFGGNGAMNRFLLARAQGKSVVSVRLSLTLKVACSAMLVLSILLFSMYLAGSAMAPALQTVLIGALTYAVVLMIAVANDLGHPYGQGMSKIALRERFRTYEQRLEELCGNADKRN